MIEIEIELKRINLQKMLVKISMIIDISKIDIIWV